MSGSFSDLVALVGPDGAVEALDELLGSVMPLGEVVAAAWMLGFVAAMRRSLEAEEFELLARTVERDLESWNRVEGA